MQSTSLVVVEVFFSEVVAEAGQAEQRFDPSVR